MVKSPSDKNGVKKGPWTPEEDEKLIAYIQKHGQGKWRTLPKNAGLKRCGKSCRLRWTNYLRPDIKRGSFSLEEEQTIIQLHGLLGNKWSGIASRLPGRTDNEIKNYWNTHIKKKLLKMGIDPVTHAPRFDLLQLSSILSSSLYTSPQLSYPSDSFGASNAVNQNLLSLAAALLSSQYSTNPDSSTVYQTVECHAPHLPFSSQPVKNGLQLNDRPNQICGMTTTLTSSTPVNCGTPFEKARREQFSPAMSNLSFQNSLTNLWQYTEGQSDQHSDCAADSVESSAKLDSLIELLRSQILQPNQDTESFPTSFSSLLSSTTTSSSPTPLNSTANGSVEDDRDSNCSNRLMYNVHNTLRDSRFM